MLFRSLKAGLQRPGAVGAWFDTLEPAAFTFPPHAAVHAAVMSAGGATAGAALSERGWVDAVLTACPDDAARGLVTALVTERGVCPASEAGLLSLYPERAQAA